VLSFPDGNLDGHLGWPIKQPVEQRRTESPAQPWVSSTLAVVVQPHAGGWLLMSLA